MVASIPDNSILVPSTTCCLRPSSPVPQADLPLKTHTAVVSMGATGGDLIDLRENGTGHLGVTVGDVTGHGEEASGYADQVRAVLGELDESNRNHPHWLEALNARLLNRLDDDHFLAAVSACLTRADRANRADRADSVAASIAVAGMPAPLIVRRNGSTEWLKGGAIPLGIESARRFLPQVVTCRLEPGDMLVVFSDGLTEAHGAGSKLFGCEPIERLGRSLASAGGASLLRGLLAAVHQHLGGCAAKDDMAVAVMENVARKPEHNRHAA